MAAFLTPADAVAAALAMRTDIAGLQPGQARSRADPEDRHPQGAAIAVTLNERLDYFGQTVNIAARIQHQAGADEIYMSEDVYEAPGVQALLEFQKVESKVSQLKGVQQGLRLFCVSTERRDGR